jgi:predicted RNase H-like HicB family nuclease
LPLLILSVTHASALTTTRKILKGPPPLAASFSGFGGKFYLTEPPWKRFMARAMKQRYHTIIKLQSNGTYVGWVEEVPGALTFGRTLEQCREKLRDSLQLLVETHRDEARRAMDASCMQESIEIDLHDNDPSAVPADVGHFELSHSHA